MTAELQLLLATLRPSHDAANEQQIHTLLSETLNWDYLLSMAEWHGVLPLVARGLSAQPTVPDAIRSRLQQAAFATAARNLHIASLATRIAVSLESAGVPVISYKGVVLSQLLYGSTAMRPVADIDLIIHPEHFQSAVSLLAEQGFEDRFGFSDAQRSAVLHFSFEHGFRGHGVHIDAHWRIAQRFVWPSLSMSRVWQSLAKFSFLGQELRVFAPDLMLAALCVHAAQDDWVFLKSSADIAQLIEAHPQLDWDKFMSWFGDAHSRRSMVVALRLARDYLGVKLPDAVAALLGKDSHAQRLTNWVVNQWSAPVQPVPEQAQVSQWLFHTRGERLADRARYVAGVLLWPTLEDFQVASFPGLTRWLYFIVRPFRIAGERFTRVRERRVRPTGNEPAKTDDVEYLDSPTRNR